MVQSVVSCIMGVGGCLGLLVIDDRGEGYQGVGNRDFVIDTVVLGEGGTPSSH